MNRFQVFIWTVLLFFLVAKLSGGSVGVSSQCINGECFVTAATSPLSIILGLIFGAFIVLFPHKNNEVEKSLSVGILRRFGAFFVDFISILIVFTPLLSLPIVLVEYYQTGTFVWSFQREFTRASDNLLVKPTIISMFIIMFYYFYKHSIIERPTLGQYILGYKVIGIKGKITKGQAILRVLFSSIGLCVWPISVILAMFNNKVFWWDKASETHTKRLIGVNKANSADVKTRPTY